MNERERAIGRRVKLLREKLRYSQREFGELIGLTRIQLAAIEAGQTPLKYRTAHLLLSSSRANPVWLAIGEGPIEGYFYLPPLQRSDNDMFSEVFFGELRPLFENEKPDPKAEMDLRYQLAHVNANLVKLWFLEYAPDGRVRELEKKLKDLWSSFLRWDEQENPKRRLQRMVWYKRMDESIKAKMDSEAKRPKSGLQPTLDKQLPIPDDSDVTQPKSLPELIGKLKKLTQSRGMKAALAEHCRVSRQAVDQWLSGHAMPSATAVFAALEWVREPGKHKHQK